MRTRTYPLELRRHAVQLYLASDPKPVITELARQLGVHPASLRTWIRDDAADRRQRQEQPKTGIGEENLRLKQTLKGLHVANDVLRAARTYYAPQMWREPVEVMNFVEEQDFSGGLVLRALGIPRSTYYDWRKAARSPSQRTLADTQLLVLIDEIRGESEYAAAYGSPRVWLELRNRGVRVGRKRVERIMRVNQRRGRNLRGGLDLVQPVRRVAQETVR